MAMSLSGNWSAGALADAAEKSVARLDDAELGAAYARRAETLGDEQLRAMLDALFEAFRDRGEASEDALEDAGTTLALVEAGDRTAVRLFFDYAAASPGLLKEATMLFVERQPADVDALPPLIADAIVGRLAGSVR